MAVPKPEFISTNVWRDDLFKNKVVFCTGGAGSICSAQVLALVYLGADACIIGRNVEKTEKAAKDISTVRSGARVIGIGAIDVRSFDNLKNAADRCVRELGGIDFVIAGAAGNFLSSINQLSVNAFKSVMDIDVLGSYNTLKATLPYLLESAAKHRVDPETLTPAPAGTGGRIIFVSATLHYAGQAFQTHVAVAKAGVDSLSNNVAIEFGPQGVTSNIIAPGPIANTEGMERLVSSVRRVDAFKSEPLGRFGSVRDIADATVYLFSDAGSYVSGQTLVVDGASWRLGSIGRGQNYPDSLLSATTFTNVKGMKQSKL